MHFLDYFTIAEKYIELVNPTSPKKVIEAGRIMGFKPGDRIIDYGCGYAEPLLLWAKNFGIAGVGIEVREAVVDRARKKIESVGLTDRLEIICGKGDEYCLEPHSFDHAVCLGASFVWDGFQTAVHNLKQTVKPGGKILIGEPYAKTDNAPKEYLKKHNIHTELELLHIAHDEGYELYYLIRSSDDDWAHYEADNWRGLIEWLADHPDHSERQEIVDWLRKVQDDYFRYGRDHCGFAIYILTPPV